MRWYQRVSVFIDGHRRAGWCNPVFEAMACEAAVVCTDIPAAKPLAEDGVTARVVAVDDAAAMAEAILWYLRAPGRIEAMGKRARERTTQWTYDHAAQRLEAWWSNQA